ncbi:DUF5677 domain-containing protein [Duganella sp. S19_KUP01_CR8]|uniref:DUF5677 domain-containing protein n=1 Tax=Duganella sp. S19_KUP01_CR8 TaxID=3025502 RepID=UPI002FCDDC63
MNDEGPLLRRLEKSFFEHLRGIAHAELEKGEKDFDSIEAEIMESIQPAMLDLLPEQVLQSLMSRAPHMLRERRVSDRGFERRNFKRWRRPFDALETMVAIAEEVGEACDIEGRELAETESDYRFIALCQLFPRAILVTREIIHLLKGGFPDAALSRWRSLHELTVTAMFISENDGTIALRYLASFDFQAKRAARQYNLHATRANLEPFGEEDLADLDARCAAAIAVIGGEIKGDWGWAAPAFTKESPTFADIEKAVQMDHWRPRYKWASQHVHSGHRPSDALLGVSEAKQPVMLVGRSNSGFTDPLHMTAVSLFQMTSTILLENPNIDRIVYARILATLSDNVGRLAVEADSADSPPS